MSDTWSAIDEPQPDMFGRDDADPSIAQAGSLARRYGVPPFSVLDGRAGYWAARKRSWLSLGIESELGRDGSLPEKADGAPKTATSQRLAPGGGGGGAWLGGPKTDTSEAFGNTSREGTGTSIFDPVLTEISYRWFCPDGGVVLDPFAGGSVRGIVASVLGRPYHGIELRPAQAAANRDQAARICLSSAPVWYEGDAMDAHELLPDGFAADFVFTCPPYFDLEVYSDDPRDLSNAGSYETFLGQYREIIARNTELLRSDRFAAVVVGDIRDGEGYYRGLVSDTVAAFEDAGLRYYNHAIYATPVGSLPIRIGRQFDAGRKLGKSHQDLLVFVKGDPRAAADACEVTEIDRSTLVVP